MIWNDKIRHGIFQQHKVTLVNIIHFLLFCILLFYYLFICSFPLSNSVQFSLSSAPTLSLWFPTSCIQLNDLRRQQSVIFIVATNRLRSFDAAVTRPGRFDFLLFVGTPNLQSREKRLESRLEGTRMTPAKRLDISSQSMILPIICPFRS
jgi:ATPase family associated with various cellular activities (AAA)